MSRSRILYAGILLALLITGLAISLLLYIRLTSVAYHSPIPAATLAAFQSGVPIENPTQALVAAQLYLGTTRLYAMGEILPYDAQSVRYAEALACTTQPGTTDYTSHPEDARVWLVLFEGQWQIESLFQDTTPVAPQPGCVYVILNAQDGSGMGAGGIRECAAYQARTGHQIVNAFLQEKGLDTRPGTRDYGRLMKNILLGAYPELTGPQATLVWNQAELERVLEYAGQHAQDGSWRFWVQPTEPDIPEALPPTANP